ncbi:hypothetical protein [Mesoaciditoga lauensis]|uniref:hypothetical protein n=1 Tax=Mesoaciditoga lauensis TaxID=1495039 RepID=UPI000565073D|nr:hypothetical protein [Mesoaciditoga lauensis]
MGKKKWFVLVMIAAAIGILTALYLFYSPWHVEIYLKKSPFHVQYVIDIDGKKQSIFPSKSVYFSLANGNHEVKLYLQNELISDENLSLGFKLFKKSKILRLSSPIFSSIKPESIDIFENKKMRIKWLIQNKGLKPTYFSIYKNGNFIFKTKDNFYSGILASYKVTPIYFKSINGTPIEFNKPILTPLPTVTNKRVVMGVKLHEGINDISVKKGIITRHAKITLDTTPPVVKVSYTFEPKGIELRFYSNEKAEYIILTPQKYTTDSTTIIIPFTRSATVLAIDKVGNKSTPTFISFKVPQSIKIKSVDLYESYGKININWQTTWNVVKPVKYLIYKDGKEVAESIKTTWSSISFHDKIDKYTILPIYPGNIKGDPISFTKPILTPLPTVTNKRVVMGVKLHEGINDISIKNGIITRHAKITLDTTPPVVKVSYTFEPKGIELHFNSNEKAKYIVLTPQKYTTLSTSMTIPFTKMATILAIDKVDNQSTPVVKSFILPKPTTIKSSYNDGTIYLKIKDSIFKVKYLIEAKAGTTQGEFEKNKELTLKLPIEDFVGTSVKVEIWNTIGNLSSKRVEIHFSDPELSKIRPLSQKFKVLQEGTYYVSKSIYFDTLKTRGNVTIIFDKKSGISLKNIIIQDGKLTLKGFKNKEWAGLTIFSTKTKLSDLDIEEANRGIFGQGKLYLKDVTLKNNKIAIMCKKSDLVATNTNFINNQLGMFIYNSTVSVSQSTFKKNLVGVNSFNSTIKFTLTRFLNNYQALNITKGECHVTDSSFSQNDSGLYITDGKALIASNEIKGNKRAAFIYNSSTVISLRNEFVSNLITMRIYNSSLYEAFDTIKNSLVGMEIFNKRDRLVNSCFTSFSQNKVDVSIMESGNMILLYPKLNSPHFFDRRVEENWSDERGKLRERGAIVEFF